VELGAGHEADLAQLGKRLTRAGARPSEHRSKLARALGSDDPAQPGVVADYLRQQHAELVAGDVSLRRGHDAIHATRVATRRLRSTLRVFGDLFDERRAADLDRELAWYADVLGEVRDRQVQRARFAKAFSALPPELVLGPVAADVDQRLHGDQMRYQAELNAALRTDRYVRLLEDVREWSAAPPLVRRHNAPAVQRLARRARRKADKRLAQALATPEGRRGDEALHRARKAAKRARYAVELTAPIRKRKSAKRIIKRYKALQDILGEHQDSVLAAELLRDLAARDGSAPGHNGFTYGLLYCREQQAARQTRRDAAKWPNG
jgi:CHAD domain-containing protein